MKNLAFLALGILLLSPLCLADNPTEDELQVLYKRLLEINLTCPTYLIGCFSFVDFSLNHFFYNFNLLGVTNFQGL